MNQFDKLNHICPAGSGGEGNQTRFELDNTHGLTVDYSCASCCDQATFDTIYDQHDGDWNIACNEAGGISTDCQQHMMYLESSLKCSPNNYIWFKDFPEFDAAKHEISQFPICQSFCESFYDACSDQSICTTLSSKSEWIAGGFSMACDAQSNTCTSTFNQFFDEAKVNYGKTDRAMFLCNHFITFPLGPSAISPKTADCVDPRDIVTSGRLFTQTQVNMNMTLPFETCSEELEWWWWLIISVIIIALVGGIGFVVYKLINRRKQNSKPPKNEKVELTDAVMNNEVVVDESYFDNGANNTTLNVRNASPIVADDTSHVVDTTAVNTTTVSHGQPSPPHHQTHSTMQYHHHNHSYRRDSDEYV